MSEQRTTTDGVNWKDLPDQKDLRRIFADCKQHGKDYYDELKALGLVVNTLDPFNTKHIASYEAGAKDMLAHLLRAARPRGYRIVCGLPEDRRDEMATDLLVSFFERLGIDVDFSEAIEDLSKLALDVRDPRSLIGDILPGDLKL